MISIRRIFSHFQFQGRFDDPPRRLGNFVRLSVPSTILLIKDLNFTIFLKIFLDFSENYLKNMETFREIDIRVTCIYKFCKFVNFRQKNFC